MITPAPGTQFIPLAQTRPISEHPMYSGNPRKCGAEVGLTQLADTLYEQTQLQPGRAIPSKDGEFVWVYIGQRRRAALLLNADRHDDASKVMELSVDNIGIDDAYRRSLAEQDQQLPLNEVDRYEAFADMIARGDTVDHIAKYFCVKKLVVEQSIALGGALTPEVREAWRAGEIGREAAQAFTLAPDARSMNEALGKLRRSHQLQAYHVRQALGAGSGEAARYVEFVGLDAYQAAGGNVQRDLFGRNHRVSDPVLAKSLAMQKLRDECERLKGEGWAWAEPEDELPSAWRAWAISEPDIEATEPETARLLSIEEELQRLDQSFDDPDSKEIGPSEEEDERYGVLQAEHAEILLLAKMRSFTERQRKKSGCVLFISATGTLSVVPGVIRPAEPRTAKGKVLKDEKGEAEEAQRVPRALAEADAPAPKVAMIPNALAQDLALALNKVVATVLAKDPDIALAVALAAFAENVPGRAVSLRHEGYGSAALNLTGDKTFDENLVLFSMMGLQNRLAMLAEVVAASLCFRANSAKEHAMTDPVVSAIVQCLPRDALTEALRDSFPDDIYWEKAPKAIILAAIEDMLGRERAEAMSDEKVVDLRKIAAEEAFKTGWLPPELRPPGAFWDGKQPRALPKPEKDAAKPKAKDAKAQPKKPAKKPAPKKTGKKGAKK